MGNPRKGSIDSDDSDVGLVSRWSAILLDSMRSFLRFVWNPTDKTVMGRGAKSWAQLLFFYAIYYGLLCALFAASISIVLSVIDPYVPYFQTRLQAPGLSIQPRAPSIDELSTDIRFEIGDTESAKKYIGYMDKFLKGYANQTDPIFFENCTNGPVKLNQEFYDDEIAKACIFDTSDLDRCAYSPYGYDEGKPCILVKLNRIINWFPVSFNNLSNAVGNDKSHAPPLKEVLRVNKKTYDKYVLYFSCYGPDEKNQILLNGKPGIVSANTKYYPPGIDFKYFPYYGTARQPQYKSPVIAVQFTNVTHDKEIKVMCKAYAKNIVDDDRMQVGYMTFRLEVKENKEKKKNN